MKQVQAFIFFLLFIFPLTTPAAVIHVPGDQPTIQAGIDAAVNGDTVLVADGTYTGDGNRDIDFGGKAITVRSENGAENCIIDCQGSGTDPHRGFYFHNGEGTDSILQGFTIVNGFAHNGWPLSCGAGMYCDASSPTIRDHIITANTAEDGGGGIFCTNASPCIINNTIKDNDTYGIGGGIFCGSSSHPIILGNTIEGNISATGGGGIFCDISNPIIENNTIINNESALYVGGGIGCFEASPIIRNISILYNYIFDSGGGIACVAVGSPVIEKNTIYGNISDNHGGGIYCVSTFPVIKDNNIGLNSAYSGGGIYCSNQASPVIRNNLIHKNTSRSTYGGGIFIRQCNSLVFINTTVVGNSAKDGGGGIYCSRSNITIINTIFSDNHATAGNEMYVGTNPSTLMISYSDVRGGFKSVFVESGCTLNWGPGMIKSDPLFVRGPLGDYYLSQIDAGQSVFEHLPGQAADSPCVDAGYPGPQPESMTGTTRTDHVLDTGIVDMGYHYPLKDLQVFPNPGIEVAPGREPGMVLVPGGEFLMGCHIEPCYDWQLPVHAVYVDSFYMDIYEVTNREYCDYLNAAYRRGLIRVNNGVVFRASGAEPYLDTYSANTESRIHLSDPLETPAWLDGKPGFGSARFPGKQERTFQESAGPWDDIRFTVAEGKQDHPVVLVSWFGAAAYANWRSERHGRTPCYDETTWECNFNANGYRLPTEAEWEFAARGGEHDPYYMWPWGDTCDGSMANYNDSGDPYEGVQPETTPVGYFDGSQFPPGSDMANGYGLYDMAGNIWEICNDWMDVNYYSYSPYDNPKGPASGDSRVFRGGGWTNNNTDMRCAVRGTCTPYGRLNNSGIRLVLSAD